MMLSSTATVSRLLPAAASALLAAVLCSSTGGSGVAAQSQVFLFLIQIYFIPTTFTTMNYTPDKIKLWDTAMVKQLYSLGDLSSF